MRFGSERAVPFARFLGSWNQLKLFLQFMLGSGVRPSKTENRRSGWSVLLQLGGKRDGHNQEKNE
jgi:hypothetical protein